MSGPQDHGGRPSPLAILSFSHIHRTSWMASQQTNTTASNRGTQAAAPTDATERFGKRGSQSGKDRRHRRIIGEHDLTNYRSTPSPGVRAGRRRFHQLSVLSSGKPTHSLALFSFSHSGVNSLLSASPKLKTSCDDRAPVGKTEPAAVSRRRHTTKNTQNRTTVRRQLSLLGRDTRRNGPEKAPAGFHHGQMDGVSTRRLHHLPRWTSGSPHFSLLLFCTRHS